VRRLRAALGQLAATRRRPGLARWLPPVRDARFWVVQALVLGIFLLHELVTGELGIPAVATVPHAAVDSLYLAPVLYAALNFPRSGAVATAAWVTVVVVGDFVSEVGFLSERSAVDHLVFLVMVDVVAVFVSARMAAELAARRDAERASAVARLAESRYRVLFAANASPVIVLDGAGTLLEANEAARALLAPGGREATPIEGRTLAELLGAPVAARLADGGDPVALRVQEGYEVLVRPRRSVVAQDGGPDLVQLVLDDVTEEARRRQRAEAYAAYVLRGQEDERARLARELHDDTIQELVHLCRRLDAVAAEVPLEAATLASLDEVRVLAEAIVAELRDMARGLRPPALDDLGLAASLRRLAADVAGRSGLAVETSIDEAACRGLGDDVELVLFRIAQEAMNNAEHHARARRVSLRVRAVGQAVRLEVRDDGVGFERRDAHEASGRLGLLGIHERARLVGGTVEIDSAPGRGTRVAVAVPVARRRTARAARASAGAAPPATAPARRASAGASRSSA